MKQSIGLKSIQNARELGGYKGACGRSIKHGLLLRTAKLSGISKEDLAILKDKYHVSQIIDFRMPPEISGMEDPDITGAVYSNLDVMISFDDMDVDQEAFKLKNPDLRIIVDACEKIGMLDGRMYIGILEGEAGIRGYREFFDILLRARPGEAVLWHCTAGKDRTGLATMLLLSALGVDEQTVVDDYLLTNDYNRKPADLTTQMLKAQGYDDEFISKAVIAFQLIDEIFIRRTLTHLKENYGSVIGYLKGKLDFTDSEIDELKERYLERI
ncbi:MAG: tyrosine-protein phosphatase [Lachnospiraceae bacterium]|nr:tyrosine-protein phosphatase [Lachnospiraceae bacterium]